VSSLQNILAHYRICTLKKKELKIVKIRITVGECKLICVNKDQLL